MLVNRLTIKIFLTLTLFLLTSAFVSTTFAEPTPTINYQGKLTDAAGVAVPDGTYNMRFWLLQNTSQATTSALWTESLTGGNQVQVTNGLFSVMLGSTSPLTSVDFNQPLYLGVEIGGSGAVAWDGEMSPRKILGTVPAAFESYKLGGVASSSFLRSDQADVMAASTASPLLTITQNGTGDILNLFDGGAEVFTVLDGGNVGIGTTSPYAKLSVAGQVVASYFTATSTTATSTLPNLATTNLALVGRLYDVNAQAGTSGQILSSTGTGVDWIATSTLGLGNGTFLGLTDTPSSYTANRLMFTNSGGTALTDSSNLVFNGTNFGIGTSSPYAKLSVVGEAVADKFTATDTTATSTFWGSFTAAERSGPAGPVLTVKANGTGGRVSINTDVQDGSLRVQGAGFFANEANAFGSGSNYTNLLLGNANNGALFAFQDPSATSKPFVGLSGWSSGGADGRGLYFGGGGWNVSDANTLSFYTDPTYSTGSDDDGGILRMKIFENGGVSLGNNISDTTNDGLLNLTGGGAEDMEITFQDGTAAKYALGYDDSADAFKISGSDTLGTNDLLTILSNGNVGIGTSSPTSKLTVVSTTLPQTRIGYNGTNYFTTAVGSNGATTLGLYGTVGGLRITNPKPPTAVGGLGTNATTSLSVLGATGGDSTGAYAGVLGYGGTGGGLSFVGGLGGKPLTSNISNTGGNGGAVSLIGGTGGVPTIGTSKFAGWGGNVFVSGGVGGGGSSIVAASGGDLYLTGGNGGEGPTTLPGPGGDVIIVGGSPGVSPNTGGDGAGNVYIAGGATSSATSVLPGDVYLGVSSTTAAQGNVYFGNMQGIFDTSNGRLGIGTTSPYAKLSVAGNAVVTGTLTTGILTSTSSISAPYFTATNASATSTFAGVTTSGLSVANVLSSLVKTNGSGYMTAAVAGTDYENPLTFSNGLTRTVNTVALGGALNANTTINTNAVNNLTISSTLASGGRTTYPFVVSQANDVTNNNTVGLMSLSNLDTGSTAAVLNINQAATSGTGLNFTALTGGSSITVANTTGTAITANTITTGTGLSATGLTTGAAVNAAIPNGATTASALRVTTAATAITADYSGAIINIAPTRTMTAAATRNETGNFMLLNRSNVTNGASSVMNVSGALARLQSTCTQTLGTCNDSSNILSLAQNYAASTGNVLSVTGAGTGNLAALTTTNASANGMSVTTQSSSGSQYILDLKGNAGAIDAMRVTAAGNVGIGATVPSGKLHVSKTSTAGGAGASEIGLYNVFVDTGAVTSGTDDTYGIKNEVGRLGAIGGTLNTYGLHNLVTGGTGATDNLFGSFNGITELGTGQVENAYGALSTITSITGTTNGYGFYAANMAGVSNSYGFYAEAPTSATNAYGTYVTDLSTTNTNSYGLYLANQATAGTNKYAIYSAGGKSYFGGNLGIGTTSPYAKLSVAGNAAITGTTTALRYIATSNNAYYLNSTPILTGSTTRNTFFFAGASSTSYTNGANYNYAIGSGALTNLTTGDYNFAVGLDALRGSSTAFMTGSSNNALGYQSLAANTSGTYNNALGFQSLTLNTTGSNNNALGYQSLALNTTGSQNNALGSQSLLVNISGSNNNALGTGALGANTTGSQNNALGGASLFVNTTGSRNTAVGYRALDSNNGTGTIAIGYQAAENATGVDRGIFIGYDIDAFNTTADDVLNIGNLIFGTGVDGINTTYSTGNIGIGTSSPYAKLSVAGDAVVTGKFTTSYITATSTTATSTLPNLSTTNLALIGRLYDVNTQSGTTGQILSSTGTGVDWIATSTLGLGNGTFLGLTDTPSSYTANRLMFTNSGGTALTDSSNLVFNGTNFGIGTTTPETASILTLYGNNQDVYHYGVGGAAGSAPDYRFLRARNGLTAVQDGDILGMIRFNGYDGATYQQRARISAEVNGTVSGSSIPTDLVFETGTNNETERMRLTAAGYLALGTTSPESIFTISENASSELRHYSFSSASDAHKSKYIFYRARGTQTAASDVVAGDHLGGLYFRGRANNAFQTESASVMAIVDGTVSGNNIPTALTFNTSEGGGDIERMRISSAGYLGIGTTSPYAKLSVVGDAVITGKVTASYFTATSTTATSTFGDVNITTASNRDNWIFWGGEKFLSASSTLMNTFLGLGAGSSTSVGYDNTFVGWYSGRSNTTGFKNTFLGMESGALNISGRENVFIGQSAGENSTNGNSNVYIGHNAGRDNTSGDNNVYLGQEAGRSSNGSDSSTYVGQQSGFATTGDGNSFLGRLSGRSITTGTNNTFFGYNAGYTDGTITTTNNLTNAAALGYNAQVTRSNSLILGGTGAFGVNVGIGTTSPYAKFALNYIDGTDTGPRFLVGSSTAANLIVSNTGNVGVGKVNPYTKLDLGTGSAGQRLLIWNDDDGSNKDRHGLGVDMSGDSFETNLFGVEEGGSQKRGHLSFGFVARSNGTTYTEKMRLTELGVLTVLGTTTIGDGTTSLRAGLQIGYGGICVDDDGSCVASTTGRISSVSSYLGASDLAENYFSSTELKAGEVVTLSGGLSIDRADIKSSDVVLGVVSTKPGLLLGFDDTSIEAGETEYPVALSGRVPVKLSTENGPIKRGDYLMLSSLPGVAMKAKSTGTTIGIALEDFDDTRYYSDVFINQHAEDITREKYQLVNDTKLAIVTSELRATPSETRYLYDGTRVQVGQVVMFVKLGERWLGDTQLASLGSLMSTSSLTVIGANENETMFDRLVALANRFVDGVLSVFELRANRVEVAEELCIDDVCVTADDLRTLLKNQSTTVSTPNTTTSGTRTNPTTTVVEDSQDDVNDNLASSTSTGTNQVLPSTESIEEEEVSSEVDATASVVEDSTSEVAEIVEVETEMVPVETKVPLVQEEGVDSSEIAADTALQDLP